MRDNGRDFPMHRRQFLQTTAAGLLAPALQAAPERPNIVLFLTDDLGYADLGCYGATDLRTPHIDRLAREGVKFTHCYANGPVCSPTRAALMTGRYQQRFGIEWAIYPGQYGWGLEPRHTTIATRLKRAGYRTGMFGKWHLGYEPIYGPNQHGFDEFAGLLSGNIDFYSHREINGELDWYEDLQRADTPGYATEIIARKAASFVDRHAGSPFFLYVPFNAVHWPFQAPGRPHDIRERKTWFDGTRADYARMVESVDDAVGLVLRTLEQRGAARKTLVLFTNDNGGERLSINRPFAHRKATLWEGGIRVPGIAHWPGVLPAGRTSGQPCISMDLSATVLAAAGVAGPYSPPLDGEDLLPILTGKAPPRERTFFWRIDREDRKQKAVRQGDWKWLRDGSIELLFNLAEDPGERHDVGYRYPEKLAALRQRMADWEEELKKDPPPKVIK